MIVAVATSDRMALAIVFEGAVKIKVISWVKMVVAIVWMEARLNLL